MLNVWFSADVEELSQWQAEFRGQIRALRQWLKNMEMRLPASEPRVLLHSLSLEDPLEHTWTEGLLCARWGAAPSQKWLLLERPTAQMSEHSEKTLESEERKRKKGRDKKTEICL
uniref:Uncharacterized protein n=1 Tax=Knipowitschia caucasica TaxID=637954 RepID=A0AAV2MB97_KNICA